MINVDFNQRRELCRNALKNEHTSQIPVLSMFVTGMILDSDYKLEEALYDWDIMYKLECEMIERYRPDYVVGASVRNPFAFIEQLGGNYYNVNKEAQTIGVERDLMLMEADEYEELMEKGFIPFVFSKLMPRRCTEYDAPDLEERWKKTFEEYNKYGAHLERIMKTRMEKYQLPEMGPGGFFQSPAEYMLYWCRGIKNFSIDLRRRYGQMRDACDMIFEELKPGLDAGFEIQNDFAVSDIVVAMLVHSVLNRKQFEDLWWRYFKPYLQRAIDENKVIFSWTQSGILRFADFYQDVPSGVIGMYCENDSLYDLREQLPNLGLVGGLPNTLMHNGTKEQCVDHVKKLIDDLGDHGLTLTNDKMVSYKNDFNRENLMAVMDYVESVQQ